MRDLEVKSRDLRGIWVKSRDLRGIWTESSEGSGRDLDGVKRGICEK